MEDYPLPDGSRYKKNRFSAGDLYHPPEGSLQRHRSEMTRRSSRDSSDFVDKLPSRQLGKSGGFF